MKTIPIRQISPLTKEPELSESFSIRDLREMLNGKDMDQELHRHDFFFILALKKASGHHEIDFIPYAVEDHSLFFMRPGQVHQLHLKAGTTGYLMQFTADFFYPGDPSSGKLLRKVSTKSLCQLNDQKIKKLLLVLDYIFQEYSERQEGYKEVIKANLGIFFIEFLRHRQTSEVPATKDILYPQERTDELLALFQVHISTNKQVSYYAELMHLSSYQLNAITKTTLGKTCSELINEFIILEAKRFLLATSNQVNQIAYHLGYEDVSYFIRFFKKHTRLTPEAFRLNSR